MAKKRISGADYLKIKAEAEVASGYDKTSPIWGLPLAAVLGDLMALLNDVEVEIDADETGQAKAFLKSAAEVLTHLQRREAKARLIQSRLHSV